MQFPSQDPTLRAMKALQKKDPWVDPTSEEQIQAFHVLRQTCSRITVERLRQFVSKQRAELVQTAQVESSYWVVHKDMLSGESNVQKLADLQPYLVTEEDLMEGGANVLGFDFAMYYVIDKVIPREQLPMTTSEIKFSLARTNRYKDLAPRQTTAGQSAAPPIIKREISSSSDGAAGEVAPEAKCRCGLPLAACGACGAGYAQQAAAAGAHGAATGAPPPTRTLKRVVSATDDPDCQVKRYRDVLKTLIAKIQAACDRKNWWDSDPCNSDTVHFWAQECMMSAATTDDLPGNAHQEVLVAFSKFLTKILVDNECYDWLDHFEMFYETMEKQQVAIPVITILVRRLAKLPVDSDKSIETDGVDLEVRTRFFTGVLWKDYGNKRRHRRYEKAQSTKCMQERVKLLRTLKDDSSLAPGLAATVVAALTIFDEALPLVESQVHHQRGMETQVSARLESRFAYWPSCAVLRERPLFASLQGLDQFSRCMPLVDPNRQRCLSTLTPCSQIYLELHQEH